MALRNSAVVIGQVKVDKERSGHFRLIFIGFSPARDNVDAPTRNDVYSVLVMKTFLDNSSSEVFVNEFPGELEFDAQDKHETSEFGNVNEFPGDIDLEDELGASDNENLITVIAMGMQSSRGTLLHRLCLWGNTCPGCHEFTSSVSGFMLSSDQLDGFIAFSRVVQWLWGFLHIVFRCCSVYCMR
jgi:hypothetical protein